MIPLYPGQGIGVTNRPVLGFTLGYYPVGSVLSPVDSIISDEPVSQVLSESPQNVTSFEPDDLISALNKMLIESLEPEGVISAEPITSITSTEPPDIVSEEPEGLESEEPND